MIRPFRAETERYGHYSVAGESVYAARSNGDRNAPGLIWHVSASLQREWHAPI